jgi:hypothetical protein
MSIVWNVDRARPVGQPCSLQAARKLAQRMEDRYCRPYVVLPAV